MAEPTKEELIDSLTPGGTESLSPHGRRLFAHSGCHRKRSLYRCSPC